MDVDHARVMAEHGQRVGQESAASAPAPEPEAVPPPAPRRRSGSGEPKLERIVGGEQVVEEAATSPARKGWWQRK